MLSKDNVMLPHEKPFSEGEYERMAKELEIMSESIRIRPEMNHHFADRLALLAKQMREDSIRHYPAPKM